MSVRGRRHGVFGLHVTEGVITQAASSKGISRRITVLGKLTMVVFIVLAAEAFRATGLNAEGNALLDFKNAITSDLQNALQNWNSSNDNPCKWNGISCVTPQGITEERMVEINLLGTALRGTISPRLDDLVYLEAVNLETNKLSGQIPRELFKALNLTRLDLSNNDLSGDIPAEIRNLGEHLQVLEMSGNGLTGVPEDIIYCYRLQRLILSKNNIIGFVPMGLGLNLTQLERLDLSVNRFEGAIPDDFGGLTTLKVICVRWGGWCRSLRLGRRVEVTVFRHRSLQGFEEKTRLP